jgi:predicted SnoaL-like aldol condensation-catalyzing enzyme
MAQDATPAADEACPATTPEENKEIVAQYGAALGGEAVDLATVLADDHVVHLQTGEDVAEPGHEDVAAWIASRGEDYPDREGAAVLRVAEGDLVAVYVTVSGTHSDDHEEQGYPATGMPAEWVVANFFRIECGKIAEQWVIQDTLGRLMDIGVITAEELQTAEVAATPAP